MMTLAPWPESSQLLFGLIFQASGWNDKGCWPCTSAAMQTEILSTSSHLWPLDILKLCVCRMWEKACRKYTHQEKFEAVYKNLKNSSSVCNGWKTSFKLKMSNYRTKMHQLEQLVVTINGGKHCKYVKHSVNGEPPHNNIKKPRKGKLSLDSPEGIDGLSLKAAWELNDSLKRGMSHLPLEEKQM